MRRVRHKAAVMNNAPDESLHPETSGTVHVSLVSPVSPLIPTRLPDLEMLHVAPTDPIKPSDGGALGEYKDGCECHLFLSEDSQTRRKLVAKENIYKQSMHHGREVRKGCARVTIKISYDDCAPLPFPEEEAATVGMAKSFFVEWPKELIEIIQPAPVTKVDKSAQKKKGRMSSMDDKTSPSATVPTEESSSSTSDPLQELQLRMDNDAGFNGFFFQMTKEVIGLDLPNLMDRGDLLELLTRESQVSNSLMQLFTQALHELAERNGRKGIGFLSADHVTPTQTTLEARVNYIARILKDRNKEMYLVPYLQSEHWMLMAIRPVDKVVYWFDSLQNPQKEEAVELMDEVMFNYQAFLGLPRNVHMPPLWIVVKHKRKTSNWECVYYVMHYMYQITMKSSTFALEKHFKIDRTQLSNVDIDAVRKICARYILEHPS